MDEPEDWIKIVMLIYGIAGIYINNIYGWAKNLSYFGNALQEQNHFE